MTNQPRDFDVGVARRLADLERQLAYLKSILARGDQATDTASSVTFDSINVGAATGAPSNQIHLDGVAPAVWIKVSGASAGFYAGAGTPVQLYRSAANTWGTPNNLAVDGTLQQNSNYFQGFSSSMANGATLTLGTFRGLILISNASDDKAQLVIVNAGAGITSVADQGLGANLGTDAGTTLALYKSGSDWILKNRYGSTKTIRAQILGN